MKKSIQLNRLYHRGKHHIRMDFPFDSELRICVDRIEGRRWSATNKCWYVENKPGNLEKIINAFKGKAWVDASSLYGGKKPRKDETVQPFPVKSSHNYTLAKEIPKEYTALLKRRNYSPATIRTYTSLFKKFINYFPETAPEAITEEQIRQYQDYIVNKRKVSTSTHNQVINSIKFYFEHVLGHEKKTYWIDRPKKEKKLPHIISEEDVVRLLAATVNLKQKCIIAMLYSAGLRRGELVGLRVGDIDVDRSQVFVRGGKGKKDRSTVLGDSMAIALQHYVKEYKPAYWLFEGPGKKRYSSESVRQIVKQARNKAGIVKTVTPHVLRHSFATHLMDHGTDSRFIQELLGHESLNTTAIYAHVSTRSLKKIKSPLDRIFERNPVDDNDVKKRLT